MPLDTPLSLFPNYLTPPIEGRRERAGEGRREGGEGKERRTSSNPFLLFFFFWSVAFFNLKSSSSIRRHYPSHYTLIKASSPAPTMRINVTIGDKVVVKKKKDINLTMTHWGLFSRRKNFRKKFILLLHRREITQIITLYSLIIFSKGIKNIRDYLSRWK